MQADYQNDKCLPGKVRRSERQAIIDLPAVAGADAIAAEGAGEAGPARRDGFCIEGVVAANPCAGHATVTFFADAYAERRDLAESAGYQADWADCLAMH